MLDWLLLGVAVILWGCYCCRKRHGVQGLRRVPILSEPKEKMTEEERLALIEKQLVTVTIGGGVQSLRNIITSAQILYEANCCNCSVNSGQHHAAKDEKDCENEEDFNDAASQRSCLSRTWSAASTTIAQHRQEECIVCFEEYKEGDVICWAKTDQCQHVFHKACAVEWLKQHDECPLCRINVLLAKTITYEQDENEIDATDLELGGGVGSDNGEEETAIENNGADVEAEDTPSASNEETTSERSLEQAPSNSSFEEDTLSQTKPEGYFMDDNDVEMANTTKDETGSADASDLPEVPTRLVDFTGSIQSMNGE